MPVSTIRRVIDEYPQIRRVSEIDLGFICVDRGPRTRPRYAIPSDAECCLLPEGPHVTVAESRRIDRGFDRRGV